jgi:rhodanese-related sulfurtransferase
MLRIFGWVSLVGSLWAGSLFAGELSPLSSADLQKLESQGAVIVDIRTAEEWKATGIIPGSQTMTFYDREGRYDLPQFSRALNQIAPDPKTPVVLVCRSGHRSGEAGKMLAAQWPDRKVLHLGKGITEWIQAGKPTVSPPTLKP